MENGTTYERLKEALTKAYQEDLQNLSVAFHQGSQNGNGAEPKIERRKYSRMENGHVKEAVLGVAQELGSFTTNELMQKMRRSDPAVFRRLKKHSSASACLSVLRTEGKLARKLEESGDAKWKA